MLLHTLNIVVFVARFSPGIGNIRLRVPQKNKHGIAFTILPHSFIKKRVRCWRNYKTFINTVCRWINGYRRAPISFYYSEICECRQLRRIKQSCLHALDKYIKGDKPDSDVS